MAVDGSPQGIAAWMLSLLEQRGTLIAAWVADEVDRIHGPPHVGYDQEGRPYLKRTVLDAFREASGDRVVWSMSGLCWRLRRPGDAPGRDQK